MKFHGLDHKNFYNLGKSSQFMNQDTSIIKEKIINFLRQKGPSLPVHIASEAEQSILFTSAFLSELLSEQRIKMSYMRVGSSPIYFLSGQEPQLQKYAETHLKSKEKEAYLLLKDKKILQDSVQHPAIRVALREIKDFAIPFRYSSDKNQELYWRFFTATSEEVNKKNPQEETKEIQEQKNPEKNTEIKKQSEDKKTNSEIKKKKVAKKKTVKRKTSSSKNDKFFNKIKEHLNQKQIEIEDIIDFSKKDLTLKIKDRNEEKILVAYNKKKLNDADLINAYKKAKDYNLKYIILSLGEPYKKTQDLIKAIKNLKNIEKIQ